MDHPSLLIQALGIARTDNGMQDKELTLELLPGDASTRRYYRIHPKTTKSDSCILMLTEPFDAHKNNFLLIQQVLNQRNVDTPKVLAVAGDDGGILLEDLGDATMLHCLEASMQDRVELNLFGNAIDLMLDIHGTEAKSPEEKKLAAFTTSFDEKILMWETNFTMEHLFRNYLKRSIPKEVESRILNQFSIICARLANEPKVFCHRDYHSRNIMVTKDKRFVSIDFQDARLGPRQYDLASLLRDSYYQLNEQKVIKLVDMYLDKLEKRSDEKIDREQFRKIFDLMSIQRNFKAIGSFSSFYIRRENAVYLRFIGNTFENIRRNLEKFPEYQELHQLLFNLYYF